ncbi:MAG: GNAT family N-acetyltransferase, partial [Deltaproteobacteria bacterium]|nr:GNAT family N-acetyltransferase [Deltaproteobacteria bacterium]
LAEEKGRLMAAVGGAWHDTLVRGKPCRLLYIHRERVHPEHQRKGLGRGLVMEMLRRLNRWGVQTPYWYINPDNEKSIAFGGTRPALATAIRLHLSPGSDPQSIQRLKPVPRDEVKKVVNLFNSTHTGKELFAPYTPASLNRRLSRSPEYGWSNIYGLFDAGKLLAVVGLWDQGKAVSVTTRGKATGAERMVTRLAVADYGFRQGRDEDLAMLLGQVSALAGEWDRQEVVVSIPRDSRLPDLLSGLDPRLDKLSLFVPSLTVEDSENDVWVDPIYL